MLSNYFKVPENRTVSAFLKDLNEKKNFHYIILESEPASFVDMRALAFHAHNADEKLKNLKKTLSFSKGRDNREHVLHLIDSGDSVCETSYGYFDFVDAMGVLCESELPFLETPLSELSKSEVFAVHETDKIAAARSLMLSKKLELLPVLSESGLIVGELRPLDFLLTQLSVPEDDAKNYYNEKYEHSAGALAVRNIMNGKAHVIEVSSSVGDALKRMVEKKLPSLIVCKGDTLHSVFSYKDAFALYQKNFVKEEFSLEFVGFGDLDEEQKYYVRKSAERTMKKISQRSEYDSLRISLKSHSHKNEQFAKLEVKLLLSHGNKVVTIDKEGVCGTSDELNNDKKKENKTPSELIQEALKALEERVLRKN